jgi:GntR family transcriptional repressor for pyruvate dehydrogenase complex
MARQSASMSVSTVSRRPSLVANVAAQISADIASGRLTPGSRLPPEHALTAAFGVSRATLREAIAALRLEGLIEARQGSGTYVVAPTTRQIFRINATELRARDDILRLVELRLGIEVEAASLAAERRTKNDLNRMDALLDRMDAAISHGDSAVDFDFEFHRAIADATKNAHFRDFLDFLGPLVIPRGTVAHSLMQPGTDARVYLRRIQAEHRAIQAAIVSGDPAAARRAARQHLIRGRERYRVPHPNSPINENQVAGSAAIESRGGRK